MRCSVLAVVAAFWLLVPVQAEQQPAALDLTDAETAEVQRFAEDALKAKGLLTGKVYLTRIEAFRDTKDAEQPRNALVIHYRYDGDMALLTSVNVGRKQVTNIKEAPHFPTSLTAPELVHATKLAWASAEFRKAMARYGDPAQIEVDALMLFTGNAKQTWHNHRAVRLFFHKNRDYLLYAPYVDVDLTTETVQVERIGKMHEK